MSYDDICNRTDWSMDDSEFAEFVEGGYFLWDNTLRDIIAALEPSPGSPDRQAMDSTFLNHFEILLTAASAEAAVEFAQSSPMGKCQDVNVDWIMPYCFDGAHWVTVIISRQEHYWGVYDSLPGCEYAGLFAAVEFLVKSLHVEREPEKEWEFDLLPTIQQDDGWSCGIHTVEHVLHFLRDGGSHLGSVDVKARRQEYYDAFLELEHPQAMEYSPEDAEEVPCVLVSDQRQELDASSPVLRSSPVPVTFGEIFPGNPPYSPTEDGESEKVPSIAISPPCKEPATPSPLLPDPALGDFDPPTMTYLTHSSTFPESLPLRKLPPPSLDIKPLQLPLQKRYRTLPYPATGGSYPFP
ncbi:hypothetical protein HYALB_00001097 [Hymenoscyphus albidus]|uniref:Ubiquitin-like protease family profile domain-containing protein n=1 Tax=Hymenoscyphus albidus TaxID=595503 RepID=A0A9N9QCU9_9HELO|nr:hypothetical protein HYALB_00001097 [Hymenoscyphus albidus]